MKITNLQDKLKINEYSINKLNDINNELNLKLNNLRLQQGGRINPDINNNISINFISNDQIIRCSIPCNENDLFAQVEDKLYKAFPEYAKYRNTNNIFLSKGETILRFKTIKENNLKNNDTVILVDSE